MRPFTPSAAGLAPVIVTLMMLHAGSLPARAATLTWTGAVSERTEVAGNWSPAQVPAASDDLTWHGAGGIFVMFGLPAVQSSRSWTITQPRQIHTLRAHTVAQNLRLTGFGSLILSSIDSVIVNGDLEHEALGTLTIQAGCPVVGADSARFSSGAVVIDGLHSRLIARHVLRGQGGLAIGNGARLVATQSLTLLDGASVVVSGASSSLTAPSMSLPPSGSASLFQGRMQFTGTCGIEGSLLMSAGAQVTAPLTRVLPGGSLSGHGTIAGRFALEGAQLSAQSGKLTVGDAAQTAGVVLSGTVAVQSGSELECRSASPVGLSGFVSMFGGTLRSATGFVLDGDGYLVVRGTIAGNLEVVSGEFGAAGEFGGTPASVTVQGDWTQGASGRRSVVLTDFGAAWEADSVVVTGQAEPGGTLDITYDDSGGPPQNAIPFLFYASRPANRTFDAVTLNGVPVTNELQIVYLADRAVIQFGGSVSVQDEPSASGALRLSARPGRHPELRLTLPEASEVRIDLLDVAGRVLARIHDGALTAGQHRIELGSVVARHGLASGLYFARARVGPRSGAVRMCAAKWVLQR